MEQPTPHTDMVKPSAPMQPRASLGVPVAIVIAGALIAGSIFLSRDGSGGQNGGGHFGNNNSPAAQNIRAVDDTDHVRGNPQAPVSIVEFSDFECPFCGRIHGTLTQVLETFPDDVKWVYRHFPLVSIHDRALSASVASECVASLAGNDAFWTFTDRVFANQRNLGESLYTQIANDLGIDSSQYAACVADEATTEKVAADLQDAVDSGGGLPGNGTPYVVVINGDGDVFPFSGALPYESVEQIVRQALN